MNLETAIANRVLNLCKINNITLNKLATMSGITQSTLDNIIKGNSKNPKLKTLMLIADAFKISILDFLNDKNILNSFYE